MTRRGFSLFSPRPFSRLFSLKSPRLFSATFSRQLRDFFREYFLNFLQFGVAASFFTFIAATIFATFFLFMIRDFIRDIFQKHSRLFTRLINPRLWKIVILIDKSAASFFRDSSENHVLPSRSTRFEGTSPVKSREKSLSESRATFATFPENCIFTSRTSHFREPSPAKTWYGVVTYVNSEHLTDQKKLL